MAVGAACCDCESMPKSESCCKAKALRAARAPASAASPSSSDSTSSKSSSSSAAWVAHHMSSHDVPIDVPAHRCQDAQEAVHAHRQSAMSYHMAASTRRSSRRGVVSTVDADLAEQRINQSRHVLRRLAQAREVLRRMGTWEAAASVAQQLTLQPPALPCTHVSHTSAGSSAAL